MSTGRLPAIEDHPPGTPPASEHLADVHRQLADAEALLTAIRTGTVDSLVIGPPGQQQVYTLASADRLYRAIVDGLNEGAATASEQGTILYSNARLATMLDTTISDLVGTPAVDLVAEHSHAAMTELLSIGAGQTSRTVLDLTTASGRTTPVIMSVSGLDLDGALMHGLIATDLTQTREAQRQLSQAHHDLRSRDAFLEQAQIALGLGTWEYQIDNDRLLTSTHAGAITGLPPESHGGHRAHLGELVHPDDRVRVTDLWQNWLDGATPQPIEHRLLLPGNVERWVRQGVAVERDEHDCPVRMLGVIQDITERVHREQALRASEEQFRAVFENAHEGLYRTDNSGKPQLANPAAANMLGFTSPHDMISALTDIADAYEDSPTQRRLLADVVASGAPREGVVTRMRRNDGSTFPAIVDIIPLTDGAGTAVGVQGMVYDITVRVRAEEEIARQQQELTRLAASLEQQVAERTAELSAANRSLEAFTYSVSHDLRAPLRSLSGFSEALLAGHADQLDPDGRHYAERIIAASERMGRLIDELLALCQVSRTELRLENIDLTAMARHIIDALRRREPGRTVDVLVQDGLQAQADATLIETVLDNLLGNAWKFTARQSQPHVEFGMDPTRTPVSFYVRDNGAGFDMEYADKLFLPFQRLHTAHEFPGTGVGLASVAQIIDRHGGTVWAEAAIDSGATFYFTLPDSNSDLDPDGSELETQVQLPD